jgi:hypothetical protein
LAGLPGNARLDDIQDALVPGLVELKLVRASIVGK